MKHPLPQYVCAFCFAEYDYKPKKCAKCGTIFEKEETLPLTKADRHQQLCEKLNEIYRKKNEDYGDSFGQQFEEYGEISSAIRLEDKLKRFKQLIKHPAQVKDESKIDTLVDLANYALMTVIELENGTPE